MCSRSSKHHHMRTPSQILRFIVTKNRPCWLGSRHHASRALPKLGRSDHYATRPLHSQCEGVAQDHALWPLSCARDHRTRQLRLRCKHGAQRHRVRHRRGLYRAAEQPGGFQLVLLGLPPRWRVRDAQVRTQMRPTRKPKMRQVRCWRRHAARTVSQSASRTLGLHSCLETAPTSKFTAGAGACFCATSWTTWRQPSVRPGRRPPRSALPTLSTPLLEGRGAESSAARGNERLPPSTRVSMPPRALNSTVASDSPQSVVDLMAWHVAAETRVQLQYVIHNRMRGQARATYCRGHGLEREREISQVFTGETKGSSCEESRPKDVDLQLSRAQARPRGSRARAWLLCIARDYLTD